MDSACAAAAPVAAVNLSASSRSTRTTGTRTSSQGRGMSRAAQPAGGSLPYTHSCPKLPPHLPSSATMTPMAPARCAASTCFVACVGGVTFCAVFLCSVLGGLARMSYHKTCHLNFVLYIICVEWSKRTSGPSSVNRVGMKDKWFVKADEKDSVLLKGVFLPCVQSGYPPAPRRLCGFERSVRSPARSARQQAAPRLPRILP